MDKNSREVLKNLAEKIASNNNFTEYFKGVEVAMESFRQTIEVVTRGINQIPESVKVMANHGWYLTWDFLPGVINHLAHELEKGNTSYVNAKMIGFVDEVFESFFVDIPASFPHRRSAVIAALNAHKCGEYYLSIPVFFAQIEGMCKELTGARFFSQKSSAKTIRENWINSFKTDSILAALMAPLREPGPVRNKQILENPIGINRHDVLHGDSNDYGEDKVNGYKVLSLLAYVATTVSEAKKDLS